MPSAVDLVRRFRDLRVLVIGDAMLDSYLEGTAARLCTEGPVPVVRKTGEHRAPGGAGNTSCNLCALGAEVVFLAVVGDDLVGQMLRSTLRERGVDDRWLIEDPAISTVHKLRILADGQYVVRFDEGESQRLSPAVSKRLLARLEEVFPDCDAVVMSDYGYGVVASAAIQRLRALRAQRPCPLLVDSKDPRRFRGAGATVVTPNHVEARLAVERSLETERSADPDEMAAIGRRLLTMIDAEHVAITMAEAGVVCVDRDGISTHLPAHPVAAANDVGAGDSFASAMALALAAGADCIEAARIGIDAASVAITKRWTAVVHHQELLQRVSLRDHAGAAEQPAQGRSRASSALPHLMALLAAEQRTGRRVVFTNGVFDILHAGHVEFLRRARELGDTLVVGINSDTSARRLKGKDRPINSERDRQALVAALDSVDHVVLFDEDTPAALIRALRPDVHVKGGDYADVALPETEAVHAVGGRIEIVPLIGSLSTSHVIDRIVALAAGAPTGTEQ